MLLLKLANVKNFARKVFSILYLPLDAQINPAKMKRFSQGAIPYLR